MRTFCAAIIASALLATIVACGSTGSTPTAATPTAPAIGTPSAGSTFVVPSHGLPGVHASAVPVSFATGAASSIDSCSLLSDSEIHAAAGAEVAARKPSTLTQVFSSVCDIDLDNGASITVSVLPAGGKDLYETSFEPYIGEDSATLDQSVTGLGDKAGRSGDDELMVLKGDVLFDLLYIEFGRNDKYGIVSYLAQTVLAKLSCAAAGCAGFTPLPLPSSAAAIDVCSLLTTDQIQRATKYSTSATEPGGAMGHDQSCTWTLETDSAIAGSDWLEIETMTSGGKSQFEFLATAYDPPLEHVPGLGDDAIKTATIPSGSFYVLKGDELITVSFSMPLSVDDPYALVQPLVTQALAALP